jgi:hypothetical protein
MSRSAISEKTSTQIADLSDGPAPRAEVAHESQVELSAEWVLGDSVEDARFPTGIPG